MISVASIDAGCVGFLLVARDGAPPRQTAKESEQTPSASSIHCHLRRAVRPSQLSHPHPHYLLSLTARADLYQIARSAINRFFANPWIMQRFCQIRARTRCWKESGRKAHFPYHKCSPLSSRDQERKKQDAKGRNQQKKSRAHKNRTTVLLQQTNKSGICLNYLSVQFCS
jgi:hypothetical protein